MLIYTRVCMCVSVCMCLCVCIYMYTCVHIVCAYVCMQRKERDLTVLLKLSNSCF